MKITELDKLLGSPVKLLFNNSGTWVYDLGLNPKITNNFFVILGKLTNFSKIYSFICKVG